MNKKRKSPQQESILNVKCSNLEKILFRKNKITKRQLILYYQKIAPFFLKYGTHHLMVMHRFPNGIESEGFFQKEVSAYFPKWVHRHTVALKKGSTQSLVVVDSAKALVYLANQAVVEFHSWLSDVSVVSKPDKIVFDLDPSGSDLKKIRFVAVKLKEIIEQYGLVPFLMTTGSRGYHLVIPIRPEHSFTKVHDFAKNIARSMVEKYPDHCTVTMNLKKRQEKVFIDYLRNSYGQTSIACYSVRSLETAPVATPILWSELSKTKPQKYTIKNIFKRVAKQKDPWKDFFKKRKKLSLTVQ